jgi:hypothetical protein
MADNSIKQRANAQFKKLPGAEDRKSVLSESQAGAAAVAAKTARLKELRLARDAAELAAPPKPVPAKTKKKKTIAKKKKRPDVSLSDWLKSRQLGSGST